MDVDRLRLRTGAVGDLTPRAKLPKHGLGQEFLKGPVPLAWLHLAAGLPGKALALAMLLWFKAGAQRGTPTVRVTADLLAKLSINRQSGRRALSALERARLVSVERRSGRCHLVTILDVPKPARGPPGDV